MRLVGQFGVMRWSAYAVLEIAVRNEAMPAAMARKRPKSRFCISPPKHKSAPMLRPTCARSLGPSCDGATQSVA